MIKTLSNTIRQDRAAYKIPRSVQDVLPIQRIFADGIFQFGTKYSKTLCFSDINYAIASKEDKTAMFLGYSELLNALDSGSTTKLTICNKQVNRQAFEDTVLLPHRGDSLDGFVDEFNGMLEGKISGSSASVEQERFITVSVHKKNVDEARTFFSRVTGEVSSKLSRLNSSSNELDAAERLDVLRGFFCPAEAAFPFDLQSAMKRGHNLKDTICPDSLEFHRDYFKMGNQYGRVRFLKDYASYIKDSMILEQTDLNRRIKPASSLREIPIVPKPDTTQFALPEIKTKSMSGKDCKNRISQREKRLVLTVLSEILKQFCQPSERAKLFVNSKTSTFPIRRNRSRQPRCRSEQGDRRQFPCTPIQNLRNRMLRSHRCRTLRTSRSTLQRSSQHR